MYEELLESKSFFTGPGADRGSKSQNFDISIQIIFDKSRCMRIRIIYQDKGCMAATQY